MGLLQEFYGPNAGYVLELYELYQRDPAALDPATRALFEQIEIVPEEIALAAGAAPLTNGGAAGLHHPAPPAHQTELSADRYVEADEIADSIMGVVNYAKAIREYGHMAAQLDPLALELPKGDPELDPIAQGLTRSDMLRLPANLVGGPISGQASNAYQALEMLKEIYCDRTGHDYDHIREPKERAWLRSSVESRRYHVSTQPIDAVALLRRLTEVEVFEDFLQKTFPPSKYRFSIEGLDMMVPILDEIIDGAAGRKVEHIVIAMAHRGRLNILAHILKRPYDQILSEFVDQVKDDSEEEEEMGWTGDVKYHRGQLHEILCPDGRTLTLYVPPNPSHLEAVNPVAEGMARAAASTLDVPGAPQVDVSRVLTILIHGDAAFPGQGVVAETMNLAGLPGFRIGGTIHIIANNQLGFTTEAHDARSTRYASDLAKGFKVPIVHVNADAPEACIEVARLAFEWAETFERDFVIDLIGYRRYGHNEGDEPRFTQPVMYQRIDAHPRVRAQWAETLAQRGLIQPEDAQQMVQEHWAHLQAIYNEVKDKDFIDDDIPDLPSPGLARRTDTRLPAATLLEINAALRTLVNESNVLGKLKKALRDRRDSFEAEGASINWAAAEEMALATVLAQGIPVRLTGQDVERGTFSQRHAVLNDEKSGAQLVPLQNLPQAQASFEIHNSALSEVAVLGFEYGYCLQATNALVLWEAQYGDFINNAQLIVDEFIVSSRAKWGDTPSLVLLLPHGYEGAGPDHSSARLERFLELGAKTNIRVAYPTTPAQYYHLLRRQALLLGDDPERSDPLPLIIMTPKSLLRRAEVVSSLADLVDGLWQPIIDDARYTTQKARSGIQRLVLCSGKFYYDLLASPHYAERSDVAIARMEQLYPFPVQDMRDLLASYPKLKQIIWAQEEPKNMGAWDAIFWRIERIIAEMGRKLPLDYVGRRRGSSPAEGSSKQHRTHQELISGLSFTWQPGMDHEV